MNGVAAWLEVMWWNLLANALQHGGNRIELGWEEGGKEFYFWICDQGGGVPMEKRGKLFQPFHFLHEPDAAHGLGLGIFCIAALSSNQILSQKMGSENLLYFRQNQKRMPMPPVMSPPT